jgi:hypothetical protein
MTLTERLYQVHRAECRDVLISVFGQTPELAELWCAAWEHEADQRGWPTTSEFWDHGRQWIDAQIQQRRSPTATGETFIAAAKELG